MGNFPGAFWHFMHVFGRICRGGLKGRARYVTVILPMGQRNAFAVLSKEEGNT